MSKNIIVNSKDYKCKEINFNAICELEELGFSITNINLKKNLFSTLRACFAFHSGLPLEIASKEIENHLANGGDLEDLMPFVESIVTSDFFDKMQKKSK